MIISDFDNTIFSHRSMTVPPAVKKAIDAFKAKGGQFVLCTGRMYLAIKKYALELGLTGEILCLQGSVCYSLDDDREIFVSDINEETTYELLTFLESQNWTYQFYHDLRMFTKNKNRYTDIYEQLTDIKATYTEKNVSEVVRENGYSAHKVIVMTEPEEAEEKIEILSARFPELDVSQSSAIFIEIVDRNGGKGNGVKKLCEMKGIPLSKTVVMGDETNDMSMLLVAGLPCCPDDAVKIVRNASRVIFPSVHLGGAADMINAIIDERIG